MGQSAGHSKTSTIQQVIVNVYLDSIGCRLNQSEIETLAAQFRSAGHTLVENSADADMVVLNTCSVTKAADADSRKKVRQAARAGNEQIVVTGCWATLDPESAASLPGVVQVVSNAEKEHLAARVLNMPPGHFTAQRAAPKPRRALPGSQARTRVFIKAQDGCDNHCTYCVTRIVRGAARSRPLNEVLEDIQSARLGGAQEVVLTGVHLASWGQDFGSGTNLGQLVEAVLAASDVPRLRLSSLESWDLDESFFSLWQDARLCRQLHLPLQSASGAVLQRMGRRPTPQAYAALVRDARAAIPEMAVTTDIIVGFPGESTAEHQESLDFVKEIGFAGGHVFSYSPRPGTPAAQMLDDVPKAVKKERSAQMRALLAESERRFQEQFRGRVLPVLWESTAKVEDGTWQLKGLSDNYLRVRAAAAENLWNQISQVRIRQVKGRDLMGEIVNQ